MSDEKEVRKIKFKYVGRNTDSTAFGLTFRKDGENTPQVVEDERVIGKLLGNPFFDVVGAKVEGNHTDKPKVEKQPRAKAAPRDDD